LLSNNVIIQVAKQRSIISGNKDKCTDPTCPTEGEMKSPCANGKCTTPTTPSAKGAESIANHTPTEGRKSVEKKSKNKTLYVIPRLI
jgi:hypothetical protein